MRKTRKAYLLSLVLAFILVFPSMAFAHETYIKMAPFGEAGQAVTVELIRGHFPATPEPGSYFEEMLERQDLEWRFYLLHPDGTTEDLPLTPYNGNYISSFVPVTGGDYQVVFFRDRGIRDYQHGEPAGMQQMYDMVKAYIHVHGEEDHEAFDRVAGLQLEIKAVSDTGHLHPGDVFEGQLLYQGAPLAGATVTLTGEDEATEVAETDQQGNFSFTLPGQGAYMLKTAYFEDAPGTAGDLEYIGFRNTHVAMIGTLAGDGEGATVPAPTDPAPQAVTPISSTGGGFNVAAFLAAAVLLLGAGYLFGKSKKSA